MAKNQANKNVPSKSDLTDVLGDENATDLQELGSANEDQEGLDKVVTDNARIAKSNNTSTAQKEADTPKILTLRAVYGKTQGKQKIRPAKDKSGKLITGQVVMTEEMKRNHIFVVTHETSATLEDGYVVNLADPIGKIMWAWIKEHPYVAENFDAAQENPVAMFYIEDLDVEMDKKASKRDLIYEAMQLIRAAAGVKKKEVMRLLGQQGVNFYNDRQVDDFLGDLAMNRPERIINVWKDKNYKVRLLLYSLLDSKHIKKDDTMKTYRYEDEVIGLNEDQAIEWLKQPRNADTVNYLRNLIS